MSREPRAQFEGIELSGGIPLQNGQGRVTQVLAFAVATCNGKGKHVAFLHEAFCHKLTNIFSTLGQSLFLLDIEVLLQYN